MAPWFRPREARIRPEVERLEDRQLLASHIALQSVPGWVMVNGTSANDRLVVASQGNKIRVTLSGGFQEARVFRRRMVTGVLFDGNGGNDQLINRTTLPAVTVPSPSALSATIPSSLTADEFLILTELNQYRANNGLPPLRINPLLQADAQGHANNMATQDKYGDTDMNGHILNGHDFIWRAAQVGYQWSILGENVAYNLGYDNPAQELSDQWWNSAEHRANMLDPRFIEVGIGVARGASGRTYGVEVFGAPAN
jgi:uncharacterized protein YkwD